MRIMKLMRAVKIYGGSEHTLLAIGVTVAALWDLAQKHPDVAAQLMSACYHQNHKLPLDVHAVLLKYDFVDATTGQVTPQAREIALASHKGNDPLSFGNPLAGSDS